MIPDSSASMIATVNAKKWREFFAAFRTSSATSPGNAKTLSEIGILDSNRLRIQVRRKVVVQIQDDKYYLDEGRLNQVNQLRNRLAIIPIAAIIIFLLVLLFYR
ncbi:MAG: hypothetical protein ABSA44_08160 [Bacteroidota bacterium]|jgi:hypothetical protein